MATTDGKVKRGGVRAGAQGHKVVGRRTGKTIDAYKVQPQDDKWVCSHCPRVEAQNQSPGSPRFRRVSFPTRAMLLNHNSQNHS